LAERADADAGADRMQLGLDVVGGGAELIDLGVT